MTDPSPVLIEVDPSESPEDDVPSILVMPLIPAATLETMPPPEILDVQSPGVQGPPGPRGVVGPQGVPGIGSQPVRVPFDTPMRVWDYIHNLGFPPSVRVLDSAGAEWESEVFTDNNRVTVTHGAPFSGVLLLYA